MKEIVTNRPNIIIFNPTVSVLWMTTWSVEISATFEPSNRYYLRVSR
jgi:hypothetical protein